MQEYKQVILVRDDLKLSRGKMSAQVAHAAVDATLASSKTVVATWRSQGMKKLVLKVASEAELRSYVRKAQAAGIVTAVITDAGHTHLSPGTTTCAAIGPGDSGLIDSVTGELKLIS